MAGKSLRMMSTLAQPQPRTACRILSLDGGGAKGFYTLGVLKQVEALLGGPLYEHFDLIFGTSTGAIIAALLALGRSVEDVRKLYEAHVPTIMKKIRRSKKTAALAATARAVFGDLTFADIKTGVGIVATRWAMEKPMIFKTILTERDRQNCPPRLNTPSS
jgi:patatin-like phospholipase/acyl hydrolase